MIVCGRNRQHDERLSQCRLADLFKLDAVGRGGGDLLKIIEDLLPVCQLAIFSNVKSQGRIRGRNLRGSRRSREADLQNQSDSATGNRAEERQMTRSKIGDFTHRIAA